MDITVNTFYYCLHGLNGKYQVYRRDQVMGPLLSAEPLEVEFDSEDDAQRLASELNGDGGVSRKVTI